MTAADLSAPEPAPFDVDSTEVLERLLARMHERDASEAPDLAGAIASILAARLEGTEIPAEVQATIDAVERGVGSADTEPAR